jgi:hypothetical protein
LYHNKTFGLRNPRQREQLILYFVALQKFATQTFVKQQNIRFAQPALIEENESTLY